jgi:hypothetical protein
VPFFQKRALLTPPLPPPQGSILTKIKIFAKTTPPSFATGRCQTALTGCSACCQTPLAGRRAALANFPGLENFARHANFVDQDWRATICSTNFFQNIFASRKYFSSRAVYPLTIYFFFLKNKKVFDEGMKFFLKIIIFFF